MPVQAGLVCGPEQAMRAGLSASGSLLGVAECVHVFRITFVEAGKVFFYGKLEGSLSRDGLAIDADIRSAGPVVRGRG